MILLLQGSTDIGRVALAEKIIEGRDDWRHLPIEGIADIDLLQMIDGEMPEELLVGLGTHLANEMEGQGFHVLLSYEDATPYLPTLREERGEKLITIHLQDDGPPPSGHDHVIPAKSESVNDLYQTIEKIILSA